MDKLLKQVKFDIDAGKDGAEAGKDGSSKHADASSPKSAAKSLAQVAGSSSSSSAVSVTSGTKLSLGGAQLIQTLGKKSLKDIVQNKLLPTMVLAHKDKTRGNKRRGGILEASVRSLDFKNLGNLLRKDDDGQVMSQLWSEVKRRTLLRYQTIERAFRSVDTSGDGAIQFLEFQTLIRNVGIPLDNRACQIVFAKAAGSDRELSLEEFKNILMAPTLEKLKNLIISFEDKRRNIRKHVDVFLRRIVMASERNRRTMLYRFQRKICTPFCNGLWKEMKKLLLKTKATEIEQETFVKIINDVSIARFQAYEVDLLQSLFSSVDRRHRGMADVLDLCTCLTLVGSEMTRQEKMVFLFKVFDTDDDGCLTHEQILKMFCCAVIHSAIARDDRNTFEADVFFGDELSLQEARRLFEMTLQTLAARGTLDSDAHLQSFDELWGVLGQFSPVLLDRLVPGTHKAAWLMKPGGIPRTPLSRWGSHRGALAYDAAGAAEISQTLHPQNDPTVHTLDNFRRDLTRTFRHAVRGEWDAVEVLQTYPLKSPNALEEDDGGLSQLPPWDPPAADDPGWCEKHNRTLTNWVRGALIPDQQNLTSLMGSQNSSSLWSSGDHKRLSRATGMRGSQSEPMLPTIDQNQKRQSRRMSGSTTRTRASTEKVASLPSLLPAKEQRSDIDRCWQCGEVAVERFGAEAMKTFNHFAREKAAQRRQVREIGHVCYNCGLCSDIHELSLHTDPFS